MKTIFSLALVALAFLTVGHALAHTAVPVGDDTYYVPVPGVNHGDDDDLTVWQESNGLAGLQEQATETEDGRVIPADSQLF